MTEPIFNRIKFTQDEENCIWHFLHKARESGYPSGNEPWYGVIDELCMKYMKEKYKNQMNGCWQTL